MSDNFTSTAMFKPNIVDTPSATQMNALESFEYNPSAHRRKRRALPTGTQGVRLKLNAVQILDGLQQGFLGLGAANGVYLITSVIDGLAEEPITFRGQTYNNIKNTELLPLGRNMDNDAVFQVYQREGKIPSILTFSLLVLRSNAELRNLGEVIEAVQDDDQYKKLSTLAVGALTGANPAFGLIAQVAEALMGLVGSALAAKPDDQLGYYQANYSNLFDNLGAGVHPRNGTLLVNKIAFQYEINYA